MSQVSGLAHEGSCPNCLGSPSQRSASLLYAKKTFPVVWHHAEVRQLGKERDDPLV